MTFAIIVGILILLALAIAGAVFIKRSTIRKLLGRSLQLRLLSVRLPQKFESQKDFKEEVNLSSQLLSILAGLKQPFVLELAVPTIGEEIHFYLAVPQDAIQFVSRQIQGLWGEAQVEPTDDYTIFSSRGAADAAYLKQKESSVIPIRGFVEANTDTFLPILSSFTKVEAIGEGMSLQIIAKPAPQSAKKNIASYINKLRQGVPLKDVLKGKELAKPKKGEEPPPRVVEEEAVKMLTGKISKPLFSVNVRLVSAAQTPFRAGELLEGLAGSFNQFAAPGYNEFKITRPRNPRELIYKYIFREFDANNAMVLGADELASIYHLPTSTTNIPKIKWLKAREAPPPPNLSSAGTILGNSAFRNEIRPVRITDEDRRRHIYTIGQTGTGKTTLLLNMAIQDIQAGKGIAVLDPHGDLIDDILGLIPENRQQDVIVFDPGDINRPVGLNMLEYDATHPEQKTFVVNEMQSIFNKLFTAETMGPMFEQYMRNALLLLMEDIHNPSTLMEVPRVFTDAEFRKDKVARTLNPVVVDFWEKEAVKAGGEASLANITPYITSKFNNFIANDFVRPIIGQVRSSFKFRNIMDEGKILLVNLSKGKIGDINAGLLGMIIVGKLLMAAFSRVDVPQEQRRDFNLYIDEFQNFTTDSISTILSEARKYRLNLVIAHQFIAQLDEKISDAVFGNVGSMIVFRVGADDAEFLVKQFEPIFTQNDLMNIDNFNAYLKLLINGETSKPFNIRLLPKPKGDEQLKSALREFSRQKYGRSREEVELDIMKRLRA